MRKNLLRVAYGGEITNLMESISGDGPVGRYRVKIIQPGQGSSGVYTAENLAASVGLFRAGTQMYMNHPSASEESDRPERSVMDLAGKLVSDAVVGDDGALYAECQVYPSFNAIIMEKWSDIGVSINAWTNTDIGPDGIVPPFDGVTSVDFVTKAGAGGALLEILEAGREPSMNIDEIVKGVVEGVNTTLGSLVDQMKEAISEMSANESKVEEAEDKTDEDKEKEEEEKAKKAKESFDEALAVASAIAESDLPDAAKARVRESFKKGDDIKALIEAERKYIEQATAPKVGEIKESADTPVVVKFLGME